MNEKMVRLFKRRGASKRQLTISRRMMELLESEATASATVACCQADALPQKALRCADPLVGVRNLWLH